MKAVMKQMGIKQEEIDALKVIIEKEGGGKIVIENPNVIKINMQGQESFQITGDIKEGAGESEEVGFSDEDIKMIMEKTGASEKKAREALEKTGDIAEAIIELSD